MVRPFHISEFEEFREFQEKSFNFDHFGVLSLQNLTEFELLNTTQKVQYTNVYIQYFWLSVETIPLLFQQNMLKECLSHYCIVMNYKSFQMIAWKKDSVENQY